MQWCKLLKSAVRCAIPVIVGVCPIAVAQVVLPQQDENCISCHSVLPATLENVIIDEVVGCSYVDADLYAGWGWHADIGDSCPPLDSAVVDNAYAHDGSGSVAAESSGSPVCELSGADPDGDGWGWEQGRSCLAQNPTEPNNTCIDLDGDGWGWDGTASCEVSGGNGGGGNGSDCVDPDGDGWGWGSQGSCQVNQEGADPVVAGECIDADGDGYGWDGTVSCDPNQEGTETGACVAPAAGTTLVSTTGPIRSTGNTFYPDNGPQCVVPTNQFNGPGLGFGDFLLLNNAWNGDKSSWDWSQCISLSQNADGSVVPSWDYDWGNEDDLQPGYQEWEVKSYPEIIYGVKAQSQMSAACETTGLPVPYRDMPTIDISYSYSATQTNSRVGDLGDENNNPVTVTGGDRNVAIESFLHTSCEIERGASSNREFELMVWLEHGDERLPSGSPPAAVYTDSAGRLFDVYVKGQADPGYIAYVAQDEVRNGTINWNEFFADAKNNAGTYGIKAINEGWCLANILMGSEIWWGEGTFALDYYQIKRSY